MLTEEQNRRLTQVGAGTPMGDLLRRYWMPIAGGDELDRNPVKAVRLMGEDLVLYRDLAGTLRPRRSPLSAPPRRSLVRLRRGVRAALQLSRLALRRERTLRRAAVRRRRQPRGALSRQGAHQRVSGRSEGRPRVGLPRPAAGAARSRTTSRSCGRTASCRSCSRRSRATGCNVRKTRSIPCTSSGCTATGACACAARPDRTARSTCASASTSSSTASSTSA